MIFVDSGGFIAWFIDADQHCGEAVAAWGELKGRGTRLVTTGAVVLEVLDFLARQWDGKRTRDAGDAMLGIASLNVIETGVGDFRQALDLAARFHDQEFSFTDCLSFAVMSRLGIRRAFTFDHHFRIAGMQMWPNDRAGQIDA